MMKKTGKDSFTRKRLCGYGPGALLLLSLCLMAIQCVEPPAPDKVPLSTAPQVVQHNGYQVQLFAAPEEQLRHARALFPDIGNKKAALEVLLDHFSAPAAIRAEAQLELAYLALGADYRYAGRTACTQAVAEYQHILTAYGDQPAVCAKANWYLGWIHADLLGQPEAALPFFRLIVARYADVRMRIDPPVPWVSLVLPQIEEKTPAVYARPTYYWGSMALLEIVRYSQDENELQQAMETLWSRYNESLTTIYALRLILHQSNPLGQKAAVLARSLLDAKRVSQPLGADLEKALARLQTQTAPTGGPVSPKTDRARP